MSLLEYRSVYVLNILDFGDYFYLYDSILLTNFIAEMYWNVKISNTAVNTA